MASRAVIDDFLKQKRLAVVGVSRNPKEFSNGVFRKLKASGYEVLPVNRNASEVEGEPCYASVRDLPGPVTFQSTPPRGGRLYFSREDVLAFVFQSTPPRGGRRWCT